VCSEWALHLDQEMLVGLEHFTTHTPNSVPAPATYPGHACESQHQARPDATAGQHTA